MAKYVIKKDIIVRCRRCKTLYVPEKMKSAFFEECPVCHAADNDWENTIPLWKYNLIKLFRMGPKEFNN